MEGICTLRIDRVLFQSLDKTVWGVIPFYARLRPYFAGVWFCVDNNDMEITVNIYELLNAMRARCFKFICGLVCLRNRTPYHAG